MSYGQRPKGSEQRAGPPGSLLFPSYQPTALGLRSQHSIKSTVSSSCGGRAGKGDHLPAYKMFRDLFPRKFSEQPLTLTINRVTTVGNRLVWGPACLAPVSWHNPAASHWSFTPLLSALPSCAEEYWWPEPSCVPAAPKEAQHPWRADPQPFLTA